MYSAYLVADKTNLLSILLETLFCDTRVFWTNLVCSERCWVSIRKQVQITASWLEPFTLKPKRIFALTFWFSIKDGLGIFKQLINWSSWKKGHLQSHSSWCVSVNWEFRKGAINSSRSWANWNSGHYTEVCLHYREMFNSVPVEPCWSVFESSSSCKTNLYCEPLKHLLFRKRDIRRTLTQSVILKRNLCNKTTVNLYNKQIYVIPLVDKKTEFLLRWKILVPNYSNDDTLRS